MAGRYFGSCVTSFHPTVNCTGKKCAWKEGLALLTLCFSVQSFIYKFINKKNPIISRKRGCKRSFDLIFLWSFAEIYHQTLFLANFLTVCLITWLPLGTCMYQELQPAELLMPCLIDLCHIWSWKMHATQCLTALWPSWHVTLIYLR